MLVDGASKLKSNNQEKTSPTNLKSSAEKKNKGSLFVYFIFKKFEIYLKALSNSFV